ncbi:MAG: hypothetical protein IH949_13275 [Bacteroidetes bacterium]|nr:hypothetical protein [Bacteroidota bacterium]
MKKLRLYFVIIFFLRSVPILAQGTLADFERADDFRSLVEDRVYNIVQGINWIEESNRFWYRNTIKDGKEFIFVDAENFL